MMLFYDILRIMKTERRLAFCLCIYVTAFYGMHFTYDYNYLVLLMLLLIMDLLLRQEMCLAGNWGNRSSDEMAQALLQCGGLMLLAADGYGVNWQVPEDFLEYIRDHAVCVDHIGKYDVYVAKD